jgi:hypothetical protein
VEGIEMQANQASDVDEWYVQIYARDIEDGRKRHLRVVWYFRAASPVLEDGLGIQAAASHTSSEDSGSQGAYQDDGITQHQEVPLFMRSLTTDFDGDSEEGINLVNLLLFSRAEPTCLPRLSHVQGVLPFNKEGSKILRCRLAATIGEDRYLYLTEMLFSSKPRFCLVV